MRWGHTSVNSTMLAPQRLEFDSPVRPVSRGWVDMAEFLIQIWRGDLAKGSMIGLGTQGLNLKKGPMDCLPIRTGSLVRSMIGATTVWRPLFALEITTCLALLLSVVRQTMRIIVLFLPQPILGLPDEWGPGERISRRDRYNVSRRVGLDRALIECECLITPRHG